MFAGSRLIRGVFEALTAADGTELIGLLVRQENDGVPVGRTISMGLGESKSVNRNRLFGTGVGALVSAATANVAPYAIEIGLPILDGRATRGQPVGIGLAAAGRMEAGRAGEGEKQGGMALLLGDLLKALEAGHQLSALNLGIGDRGVYGISERTSTKAISKADSSKT